MKHIARLVIAVAVVCGPVQAAPPAYQTLKAKSAIYDISVAYPVTGKKAIDEDLAAWAKKTLQNFEGESRTDHQSGEKPYEMDVTYSIARNDGRVFAVLFEEYSDSGGAHPSHDYYTANYFLPDGWRIYLPELLDGSRGLKRIGELAHADLIRRIATGPDAASDPDSVSEGTAPDWSNFSAFILLPDAILLHFAPYQVASYAAGPQESRIPLVSLRGVMRADPRKAAASFDCAAARTEVELLICSDVGLARLDREVSQAYATRLRSSAWTSGGVNGASLRANQRAWLARRNTVCAAASPRAGCISEYYKARIAWLVHQE
jgi:uncharacterized protein YecT (DUF1311 family)